jgi:hypothetical protein
MNSSKNKFNDGYLPSRRDMFVLELLANKNGTADTAVTVALVQVKKLFTANRLLLVFHNNSYQRI